MRFDVLVAGFALNVAPARDGSPDTLKFTASLEARPGVMVTVYVVDLPRTTVCVEGKALKEKSGPAGATALYALIRP